MQKCAASCPASKHFLATFALPVGVVESGLVCSDSLDCFGSSTVTKS